MVTKKTKKEEKQAQEEGPKSIPIELAEPKMFTLVRNKDESGISGTGRVLDGIIYHTGQVVVCWRSDDPNSKSPARPSLGIYDSLKDFLDTHVNNHDNDTDLILYDSKIPKPKPEPKK